MKRKLLFVLFDDDHCRAAHAGWYACELHEAGHAVAIILDGQAVKLMSGLGVSEEPWAVSLMQAMSRGLIAGACLGASTGCGGDMTDTAHRLGIPLREGMNGHASIREFIDDGYELTLF